MRAYLAVTAVLFGLLALLHAVRTVAEWPHPLSSNPWFLAVPAVGVLAAVLCAWAVRLMRARPRGE